jgi:hypothetical protein
VTDSARPPVAWLIDDPVRAASADELGRGPFARRVADLLDLVAAEPTSTAVGLVGSWGSGKTTTLNLVLDVLDKDRWTVAKLNPWALAGPDAVVSDLLASIAGALPAAESKGRAARDALVDYAAFVTPLLSLVPVVGDAASGLADAAARRLERREGTVQERTERSSDTLSALARPVLVVIDDVDRLQPEELLALFKGVRVLGRLPYVHYLLAYDQQTVLDVLTATPVAHGHEDRALAFLEKIVTLRLDQPPTRPEQAARLLDAGLAQALADGKVLMTEDHQRRLAEETQALLTHRLTEPRAISRYLAQLRAYLPLIGPGEVDIADFAVLTFLRIAHPRLYRALSDDQRLLTESAADDTHDIRLARWRSPAALDDLGVQEQDRLRVEAALARLFPVLSDRQASVRSLESRARRRDRRASDPDHVARYFALTPPDDDMTDSALSVALDSLAAGDQSPPVQAFLRALRPVPPTAPACAMAARLIRRAESRADAMGPAAAARLLPAVLGLLPMPTGTPGDSPETAVNAWLAQLLAHADGPAPGVLLQTVDRPRDVGSPLLTLLRALTAADAERRLSGPPKPGGDWLAQVTDAAADAAWLRFEGNAALGDAAPDEPAGGMLRWLDSVWGEPEVDRRLGQCLDSGTPVEDLAARFVQTGTFAGTGEHTLVGFDAGGVARRLGPDRVRAHEQALRAAADQPPAAGTDSVTWAARRIAAAHQLVDWLDKGLPALPPLPDIPARDPGPLLNHRPDLLNAPGGEQPDLRVRLGVLAPVSASLPAANLPAPGPVGERRDQAFRDLVAAAPIAAWLAEAAPRWHADGQAWEHSTDGKSYATARSAAAIRDSDTAQGWRQQTPVLAGLQIRTGMADGTDGPRPAVLLTAEVGLWMSELTADRRPDQRRHDAQPLPAALTLDEAYDLIVAVTRCAATATHALGKLTTDPGAEPFASLVDLYVQANGGPGHAVDLAGLDRVGAPAQTEHRQTVAVTTTRLGGGLTACDFPAEDVAAAAIAEWLLRAGYRGYEPRLQRLRAGASNAS